MSDIDHVAEAERNIEGLHDFQSEEGITDASLLTVAIEAQARATLALVEQQRIGNLIAWATRDGYRPLPGTQLEIEKALGLA